jgi:flavin-dependent dehydrogenase
VEHLIVDAATFPRNKVCGDGLDGVTVRMLNQIDKNITNELFSNEHFVPSWGIRCIKPSGKQIDFSLRHMVENEKHCPFFVSKRIHFDTFLVNKIDKQFAQLKQLTMVTSITKEGEYWKLAAKDEQGELEIQCKLLVGADGDHSVVLKYLGERKIDRKHYAGSVRQYFKNVEGLHSDNLLEFYFLKDIPMGYFWIFPLPNGECNVGFGVLSEIAAKQKLNVRSVFNELIHSDKAVAARFKNAVPIGDLQGWGLPLASRQRKVMGDGWLLVGDAASMVTPSSGEGIGNGMKTGFIAAHFIKKAVEENKFSEDIFNNYSPEIFKSLMGEINLHNVYLQYPFLNNWMMNTLVQNNGVNRYFVTKAMKGWVNTAYNKPVEFSI